MKELSSEHMILSSTFDSEHSSDIGLKSIAFLDFGHFGIGIMILCFQMAGTVEVIIEYEKM